jgi:hypothetical protein
MAAVSPASGIDYEQTLILCCGGQIPTSALMALVPKARPYQCYTAERVAVQNESGQSSWEEREMRGHSR